MANTHYIESKKHGRLKFDPEMLSFFFDFINERQQIWYKYKVLKKDPPWTKIEILQDFSFTNVYRRLDPGTEFVTKKILSLDIDEEPIEKAWNNIIYRLLGRQSTGEDLGFLHHKDCNKKKIEKRLREIAVDHSVFSIAYLVSGYSWIDGGDKIDRISTLIHNWSKDFKKYWEGMCSSDGPEELFEAIREMPGLGPFLSYQIFVDWTYPLTDAIDAPNFSGIAPSEYNSFVQAGPGAMRGLCFLFNIEHTGKSNASNIMQNDAPKAIQHLRSIHAAELGKRGFPWLRRDFTLTSQGNSPEIYYLETSDIQNCLCEFHKIAKIDAELGRARRRFIYPHLRQSK